MRLDDRPVIDQLTEPTPMNHIYDVVDELHDHISDSYDKVQESIDGHLFPLLDLVPEGDERNEGFDRFRQAGDNLCAEDERRQRDLLERVAKELEARL